MTKQIQLFSPKYGGHIALVDDDDYLMLTNLGVHWGVHVNGNRILARTFSNRHGLIDTYMHRVIMGSPEGVDVVHLNGNLLDNRKANLQLRKRGDKPTKAPPKAPARTRTPRQDVRPNQPSQTQTPVLVAPPLPMPVAEEKNYSYIYKFSRSSELPRLPMELAIIIIAVTFLLGSVIQV